MNGFERNNQFLSLCGLNCGLCPMLIGKYCPGCGGGAGNQSCKIARCGIEHGCTEYCFRCAEYPCMKYENIDEYDSFITHRNQKTDLEKARRIGIESYNEEQKEKAQILERLLVEYNDGRKKSMFCTAVNLLVLSDLREILKKIDSTTGMEDKEKSAYAAKTIKETAAERDIDLTLRKKTASKKSK